MGTANPAQIKKLNLTAELVARVERIEPDPDPEPGTDDHTDAEFDAMVGALLLEYKPKELWNFCLWLIDMEPGVRIFGKPCRNCQWMAPFVLPQTHTLAWNARIAGPYAGPRPWRKLQRHSL